MGIAKLFEIISELRPYALNGEIEFCESRAKDELLALPRTPFHIAAELEITNDFHESAQRFDEFFTDGMNRLTIKALYTEMNGFDINTDRWFCSLFAYDSDGVSEDWDWLCDWEPEHTVDLTIKGLEPLQSVFANEYQERAYEDANYISSLLVVTKFQRFILSSSSFMRAVNVPIYVSAHDFDDFIARIDMADKPNK